MFEVVISELDNYLTMWRTQEGIKAMVRIKPPQRDTVYRSQYNQNKLHCDGKTYNFEQIFAANDGHQHVSERVGLALVENAIKGQNSTLFVYGQTGSGKTYTMNGKAGNEGIIQKSIRLLKQKLERDPKFDNSHIKMSFFEIYKEKVRDLLNENIRGVRQRAHQGFFVEDLEEVELGSLEQFNNLFRKGNFLKVTKATEINEKSSRSHTILTITLETKQKIGDTEVIKTSKINFVDMAGSEKIKTTRVTGAGDLWRQTCSINTSLEALRKVITNLEQKRLGTLTHIPYRDSVLTQLLKDSLGGNSHTVFIGTISSEPKYLKETISTLNFLELARKVENSIVVNEEVKESIGKMAQFQQEESLLLQDSFPEGLKMLNSNNGENVPVERVPNRRKEVVSQSDDYLLDFGSQQYVFDQLDRKKQESVDERESQGENSSHKSYRSSHSSRGIRHLLQVPVQRQSSSRNYHHSFNQVSQNEHDIVSLPQKRSFQPMDIEADRDRNSISQQCGSSDRPKPQKNPFFTQQESHRIIGSPKNTSFRDMKGSNKLSGSSSFINASERVNIVSQAIRSQFPQDHSSPNKRDQVSKDQTPSAFKRKQSVSVVECGYQLVNCHVKNNDIYGMEVKSEKEGKEEESRENNEELKTREQQEKKNQNSTMDHQELKRRLSSTERQNRALLGGYFDAEQGPKFNQSHSQQNEQGQSKQIRVDCEQIDFSSQKPIFDRSADNQPSQSSTYQNLQPIKGQQWSIQQSIKFILDQQSQVQVLNEGTTIMQQSLQTHWTPINQPNQSNERQQHQQPLDQSDDQEQQQPLSDQQLLIKFQGLEHSSEPAQERFRIFQKLVVDHINMIWFEPEDNIGREILTNGQYLKIFIKLLLLKHQQQRLKKMLERYLVSWLGDKVVSEIEFFQEYRDQILCNKKIEKGPTEQKMGGSKPNKPNNIRKSLKEEDEQNYHKYSIEANEVSEFQDRQVINSANRSQDMEKNMSKAEGPVRRRILLDTPPLLSESEATKTFDSEQQQRETMRQVRISLITGKPVKKYNSKQDQQWSPSQFYKVKYETRGGNNRKKKSIQQPVKVYPPNRTRKILYELKDLTGGRVERHPMGSGYASVQLTSKGQTQQCQVRSSIRIAEKNKTKNTNILRKSKRLSVNFQLDSQSKSSKSSPQQVDWQIDLLNVDDIKTRFKELEVSQKEMLTFFYPLYPQLLNKYAELKSKKIKLEQERKEIEQEYKNNCMGLDAIDNFQNRQDATHRLQRTQQQIKEEEMKVSQEMEDYQNMAIEIVKIIDHDVNNHGLYAIVELSSRSSLLFGHRFIVTPISFLEKAHRKWIDEDLLTIPNLVDEKQRDKIGWFRLNKKNLKMIETKSQQRGQHVDKVRRSSGLKIDIC